MHAWRPVTRPADKTEKATGFIVAGPGPAPRRPERDHSAIPADSAFALLRLPHRIPLFQGELRAWGPAATACHLLADGHVAAISLDAPEVFPALDARADVVPEAPGARVPDTQERRERAHLAVAQRAVALLSRSPQASLGSPRSHGAPPYLGSPWSPGFNGYRHVLAAWLARLRWCSPVVLARPLTLVLPS
jgi:hypothetical protein